MPLGRVRLPDFTGHQPQETHQDPHGGEAVCVPRALGRVRLSGFIAVKKITGKSPTENIKSFVDDNKIKVEEEENHEEFFSLVKSRIEKTSKIIQLANQ